MVPESLKPNVHPMFAGVLGVLLCAGSCAAFAGGSKVSVELDKPVNVLTNTSLAMPLVMSDGDALKPASALVAHLAGASALRFPGGHAVADVYHWSSRKISRYGAIDQPWVSPDNNFGALARNFDRFGTAIVVVNYGSSQDDAAGGDTGEAAAWVAYANGNPGDSRPIPRDREDWKTVGYWATLRSQQPQTPDDGLNFLRIGRARPLGIGDWQIGDQVYNNGFNGADHAGNPDLHGPLPEKAGDFARLDKTPSLSPSFFAERVLAYAAAMKTVDPSIHIGVALPRPDGQPGDNDWNKKVWIRDWNSKLLHTACQSLDFVTLEFQPSVLEPPNWNTLDEQELIAHTRGWIGGFMTDLLSTDKKNCPSGHTPRIGFSAVSLPAWARVEHPVFPALWVADTYAVLIETGAESVAWGEMHSDSMFSADGKKLGAAFMGMEMLHFVARQPGDVFVKADSDSTTVAVHATRRRDGVIGLMLINENPRSEATVTVKLSGANFANKGRRLDYGQEQQKTGAPVAQSEINAIGPVFTVIVPPYTITDILIPQGN